MSSALMREVKSDLVRMILDTYILVSEGAIPHRVPRKLEDLYESRKQIHLKVFEELLAAPGGYDIASYPNMHSFHAMVVENRVCVGCMRGG